jgi:hypothetical protein
MEGYLNKKPTKGKFFAKNVKKRWFKIKLVGEERSQELALCYYKSE